MSIVLCYLLFCHYMYMLCCCYSIVLFFANKEFIQLIKPVTKENVYKHYTSKSNLKFWYELCCKRKDRQGERHSLFPCDENKFQTINLLVENVEPEWVYWRKFKLSEENFDKICFAASNLQPLTHCCLFIWTATRCLWGAVPTKTKFYAFNL